MKIKVTKTGGFNTPIIHHVTLEGVEGVREISDADLELALAGFVKANRKLLGIEIQVETPKDEFPNIIAALRKKLKSVQGKLHQSIRNDDAVTADEVWKVVEEVRWVWPDYNPVAGVQSSWSDFWKRKTMADELQAEANAMARRLEDFQLDRFIRGLDWPET